MDKKVGRVLILAKNTLLQRSLWGHKDGANGKHNVKNVFVRTQRQPSAGLVSSQDHDEIIPHQPYETRLISAPKFRKRSSIY